MTLENPKDQIQQADFHDFFVDLLGSLAIVRELSELDCYSLDENQLLNDALTILMQNYDIERCSFFLYTDEGNLQNAVGISCDEALGLDVFHGKSLTFKIGEGIIGKAAETGELQYCKNCEKDPRFIKDCDDTNTPGSLVSVPVFTDHELFGIVNISHPDAEHFTEWHFSLLNIFKNMLGQLINNRRMYKDMENQIAIRTKKLQKALQKAKVLKKRFESMSMIDDLTGLYNRRYFYDQANIAISRTKRYLQNFCLLILDLDHFKVVNDTFGHITGDQVLIDFAKCLRQQTRSSDMVARFGGEEFVIIFTDTNEVDGEKFAERIRKKVESLKWEFNGRELSITVSIGIYCPVSEEVKNNDLTINHLLNSADHALYAAKESGRNKVVVFKSDNMKKKPQ
ncbi:MAG: diguanylate cyclase [Gammaproteobacteria bacterium]